MGTQQLINALLQPLRHTVAEVRIGVRTGVCVHGMITHATTSRLPEEPRPRALHDGAASLQMSESSRIIE
jgi:hypothetical protein